MSVEPITIRNCGAAAGEMPVVRFSFRCPRTWDSLDAGPDPRTRHCSGCQRLVYFCRSPDEAADHAVRGDCIAVNSGLVALDGLGGLTMGEFVGQPESFEYEKPRESRTSDDPWPPPSH